MLIQCLFVAFGLAVTLWIRWRWRNFRVFKELGIPGPEPNILFGNLLEMIRKNPIVAQEEWIKKYGDVVGYYYGTYPCLLVSSPEILKKILITSFSTFSDRPCDMFALEGDRYNQPISKHVINMRGQKWRRVRRLITPNLSKTKLKPIIPLLEECVLSMMDKLRDESLRRKVDLDIYPYLKRMTMDAIGRSAFGITSSFQDDPEHILLKLSNLVVKGAIFCSPVNLFFASFREFPFLLEFLRYVFLFFYNNGRDPLNELFRLSGELIKERRQNPGLRRADLLQAFLDSQICDDTSNSESSHLCPATETTDDRSGIESEWKIRNKNFCGLSDEEIQANTSLFFMAGYETTSTALAFVTHQLVNHSDVQKKVRKEILEALGSTVEISSDFLDKLRFTENVILESLRLNPPVYFFINRQSNRDFLLDKTTIPSGTAIQIPPYYLHHNEDLYPHANSFNPDRFLPVNRSEDRSVVYQAFGVGPRRCPGSDFAMLVIKIALVHLLRKYSLEICSKSEKGKISLQMYVGFLNPKNGVHVQLVPLEDL